MEQANTYLDQILQLSIEYAPKVLLAIAVLIIGFWIANRLTRFVVKALEKSSDGNRELQSFLSSIVGIGLKILVVISVAGIVGIETTSFVGIIAAMGFAIGLALQGNLSNFAAGVMILLMRPFKVGDEVKIKGYWGFVIDIQIFHTVLQNFDKTLVTVPNSLITNDVIHNLSATETRDIGLSFNIPYSEDIIRVEKLITEAAYTVPKVDDTKEPFFWITSYEDHFIKIFIAFNTTQDGFWGTQDKVNKAVIEALRNNKVQVAYPMGVTFGEFGVKDRTGMN